LVLREHTFNEIVTFEYPMWRRSYISGTIKAMVEESESDQDRLTGTGKGKIVEIISANKPRLYDDYTDLHGGIDSVTKTTTCDEIKAMVEGKEGSFNHDEKAFSPCHKFTLKDQMPLEIKPVGSPFG
jgi:hypothetical protein